MRPACVTNLPPWRRNWPHAAGVGRIVSVFRRAVQFAGCLVLAWFFFHLLGQSLVNLPDHFHEGTFWEAVEKLQGDTP